MLFSTQILCIFLNTLEKSNVFPFVCLCVCVFFVCAAASVDGCVLHSVSMRNSMWLILNEWQLRTCKLLWCKNYGNYQLFRINQHLVLTITSSTVTRFEKVKTFKTQAIFMNNFCHGIPAILNTGIYCWILDNEKSWSSFTRYNFFCCHVFSLHRKKNSFLFQ